MLLHDLSDACRNEHFQEINAAFSEDDGAPALTALLEKNGFGVCRLKRPESRLASSLASIWKL